MSTANMQMCTLEVELKEGEEDPVPHLDEGAPGSVLGDPKPLLTKPFPLQESTSKCASRLSSNSTLTCKVSRH